MTQIANKFQAMETASYRQTVLHQLKRSSLKNTNLSIILLKSPSKGKLQWSVKREVVIFAGLKINI